MREGDWFQAPSSPSSRIGQLSVEFCIAAEPRGGRSEEVRAMVPNQVRDGDASEKVQVRREGGEVEEGGEGRREAREEPVEGKGEEGSS